MPLLPLLKMPRAIQKKDKHKKKQTKTSMKKHTSMKKVIKVTKLKKTPAMKKAGSGKKVKKDKQAGGGKKGKEGPGEEDSGKEGREDSGKGKALPFSVPRLPTKGEYDYVSMWTVRTYMITLMAKEGIPRLKYMPWKDALLRS